MLAEKLGLSHQALFEVASTVGPMLALTNYCPVRAAPSAPSNNQQGRICPR